MGSYLQARQHGAPWYVRIEDIDPPREVPGSTEGILAELHRLGFQHDGEVLYQSSRLAAYEAACRSLLNAGQAFHCGCSRSDLPDDGVYPGTCRNGLPPGKRARSVRVRVESAPVRFEDLRRGLQQQNLSVAGGDFVIWRADGLPAYQLAVVVDDAFQGIGEVVRGEDLLDSTPRQVHLQRLLGLPTPRYLHLPLARGPDGRKLSKQWQSDPVARLPALDCLNAALTFLGQPAVAADSLQSFWSQAAEQWDSERLPEHEGNDSDHPA